MTRDDILNGWLISKAGIAGRGRLSLSSSEASKLREGMSNYAVAAACRHSTIGSSNDRPDTN
jgi:hypothetical protein